MPDRVSNLSRLRIALRGAVQGVGFRPFVHRLATELGLSGWVNNSSQGVFLELEGPPAMLETFLLRLPAEKPPRSYIQSLESSWLDAAGYAGFEIRASDTGGVKTALVLPDIATCPDCRREIFDLGNRRYRYPFTNCTNCGPRFSIIQALPYDRPNTTMRGFTMCPACQAEYEDPRDRRFHAQPNACPVCGPHLELWEGDGNLPRSDERSHGALLAAADAIRRGQIVAVKGLGGFHLMVAAHDDAAVRRLRERKHREEKPLALMFPALEQVQAVCEISPLEQRLLESPEAPIVLLRRRAESPISNFKFQISNFKSPIAPANPYLGVMLPYTPLHHLLLAELGFAVVATSGNLSDEPICIDEHEARERLAGIADVFLVHNRPIVRHVDDSIVRVMLDRELVLRRARGYAPLPVLLPNLSPDSQRAESDCSPSAIRHPPSAITLAVGAHLKNTIALAIGPQVFVSQHIGDLETEPAFGAFRRVIADFQQLYDARPAAVACDLHPDYRSTQFARDSGLPLVPVQHHLAHVYACMAENELAPPVLGVSWDGTGYGGDGTIWGGEFFHVTNETAERIAHFRPFRLPGGDQAVKEPRRSALGLLFEWAGPDALERMALPPIQAFTDVELTTLKTMLARGLNAPFTSSVGRLFDAVAALIGLRQRVRFEGQAAMELEFALSAHPTGESYPIALADDVEGERRFTENRQWPIANGQSSGGRNPQSAIPLDWSPLLAALLADVEQGVASALISARFHNALAEAVVAVARRVGVSRVALTGGCFQNRYLTERTVQRLREAGFRPYWHQRVPPNDGGIALGQVLAAVRGKR